MDIEWGEDGDDGKIYILQARPETVKSRSGGVIERYQLRARGMSSPKDEVSVSVSAQVRRRCCRIEQIDRVQPGDVLVTDITDPDWEPIMKRASAIVTNRGGALVMQQSSREMGIPAVVGAGDATEDQ